MSKLKEAAISVAAGAASIPILIGLGTHMEVVPPLIEACATALPHADPNSGKLPKECDNVTNTVFETYTVTEPARSETGGEATQVETQKYKLLSADEYRHRAYELKDVEDRKALQQKLISFAGGIGIASAIYYGLAVGFPGRREVEAARAMHELVA